MTWWKAALQVGRVDADAGVQVAVGVHRLQLGIGGVEAGEVGLGGPLGRQRGRLAFQHLAKFEQVALQRRMAAEHLLPGIDKMRLQPVGHVGAAAVARGQQALVHQLLYGRAQRRTRHPQLKRQIALGAEPVARLERTFEDAFF